jgi:hypothetical protein
MNKKTKKGKTPVTVESIMLTKSESGSVFYTKKHDGHLTALSSYYKRKITTERVVVITGPKENPHAELLLKVTIL